MREKTCCVTGHRDTQVEKLDFVRLALEEEVLTAVEDGYTCFLSGFAEGADLLFAEIVLKFKEAHPIELEALIPFRGRLRAKDLRFQELLARCDRVTVCAEQYFPGCFAARNRLLTERSGRVIAVYDGRKNGGTAQTVNDAKKLGREVHILWE